MAAIYNYEHVAYINIHILNYVYAENMLCKSTAYNFDERFSILIVFNVSLFLMSHKYLRIFI